MQIKLARLIGVSSAAVLLAVFVAACGDDDDSTESSNGSASTTSETAATSDDPVRVAVLGSTVSPYGVASNEAAEEAAKANGAEIKTFDAVLDPAKEVAACQDAIGSGDYQAIVIVSVIPTAGVACAKEAAKAGIPLVSDFGPIGDDTASPDPTVEGVTAQVIKPLEAQLQSLVKEILVDACADKDPCNVGWFRTPKTLPQRDAIIGQYLKDIQADNPNIKVVDEAPTELDTAPAVTATASFLQKTPDLSAILSDASQGALGAVKALKDAGKKPGEVAIVSAGGSQAVLDGVRDSSIYGTTVNLPRTEMTKAIEIAVGAARGEDVPSSADPFEGTDFPFVVTQENIDDYPDFEGEYSQ